MQIRFFNIQPQPLSLPNLNANLWAICHALVTTRTYDDFSYNVEEIILYISGVYDVWCLTSSRPIPQPSTRLSTAGNREWWCSPSSWGDVDFGWRAFESGGSLWITDGDKIMKSTEGMSPKTEKMVSILALLVPLSRGLVMRCAWHKLKRFSCLVLWYKIYQLIPLVWIMKTWVFRTFCLKIGGCYQVAERDYRICRGMKWNDDYAKLRDSSTH